jgi:EAL domain-containing protein (putative c-di-GMP-specific phosphodiesterase class I)
MRIDPEMSLCVLNACDDAQLATAIKRLETAFGPPEREGEARDQRAILGVTWKGTHANAEALAASVMARARAELHGVAGGEPAAAGAAVGRGRSVDWQTEILNALNERRLALALQPVAHAMSRKVAFHEGLLRLRNRSGRIVPASVFIPASKENGLVALLDQRVIELAAQELRGDPDLRLSVNASPVSLGNPEWLRALRSQAVKAGTFAGRLIVEITETVAVADLKRSAHVLRALKELGIDIAIDDFGSGHTSFLALRELPVDIIKIDGTFVQDVERSSDGRFFIRTLVDLARHLGCKVVGEWVESEIAADIVETLGVDYLQGRLLGAPRLVGQQRRFAEPERRRRRA